MNDADKDRSTAAALDSLGRFVVELDYHALPAEVRARAELLLTDLLGVTVAGARTGELQQLAHVWAPAAGPATVFGAARTADPDTACWLNGAAACSLELDEGNKHAQGHPAAHLTFAALAATQSAEQEVPGSELLAAIVGGYEVAARFGRATRLHPHIHPHGHWGATGAAAAAARVLRLPAAEVAAAVDAAAGLVYVTPWSVVLAGSFVRNLWVAGANVSGLIGARLAAAGLAAADGTPSRTLGEVVGIFDVRRVVEDLGSRWHIVAGYFKRHASCSYTHPAADAVLDLKSGHRFTVDEVSEVIVDTHGLSMPLAELRVQSRVAAMFSLPFVVASAIDTGDVLGPEAFAADRRADPRVLDLARRVTVRHDADLDARLPAERANRVTVRLTDGRRYSAERPNPIGDADYFPLDAAGVRDKLTRLLGVETAQRICEIVPQLAGARDARELLDKLP